MEFQLPRYCRLLLKSNCPFGLFVAVVWGELPKKCKSIPKEKKKKIWTNLHPSFHEIIGYRRFENGFFNRLKFKPTIKFWVGFPRAVLQEPCLPSSRPAQWAEVTVLCGRQTARALGLAFLLPAPLAVGKHASICFSPFRQKIKLAKFFPAGSQEALFKFSQGEGVTQQSQNFPAENFNLRKDKFLLERFLDRKHLENPF